MENKPHGDLGASCLIDIFKNPVVWVKWEQFNKIKRQSIAPLWIKAAAYFTLGNTFVMH